jgi:hypothetical protein
VSPDYTTRAHEEYTAKLQTERREEKNSLLVVELGFLALRTAEAVLLVLRTRSEGGRREAKM